MIQTLEIAGIHIGLAVPDTFFRSPLQHMLAKYNAVSDAGEYDCYLELCGDSELDFSSETYGTFHDVKAALDDTRIMFSSSAAVCHYSIELRRMKVSLKCTAADCREGALLAHLRHLVSMQVIERGGVPFHCSALERDGLCLVFSGLSGSGKSTIARLLCPQWTLLSDEFNILLPDGLLWNVFSTPFTNISLRAQCNNVMGKAHALFGLNRNDSNEVLPMTASEKFLFCAGGMYTLPFSNAFSAKLMDNASALSKHDRIMKLLFKKDNQLIDTINEFMELCV